MKARIAACIGTRDLTSAQAVLCKTLGAWLVRHGWTIRSGNATGADQAFAAGGNSVDPTAVVVCLPWWRYNVEAIVDGNVISQGPAEWDFEQASHHHPAWDRLTRGPRALMARNYQIIHGCRESKEPAGVVLAFRRPDHRGGTENAIGVARVAGIPVLDVSQLSLETIIAKVGLLL